MSAPCVFPAGLSWMAAGTVYHRPQAYQASKLMNALFSAEISRWEREVDTLCDESISVSVDKSLSIVSITFLLLHKLINGRTILQTVKTRSIGTGYMLSYCRRWGERGVRAYTVHPGFVRSGMLSKAAVSTPVRIFFTLLSYILGRSEAQVHC